MQRRLRDAGARVEFSVSYASYAGDEIRPFIEGMLRGGDKKILTRLAMDQGLIEKFLKSVTYDIRVTQGGATSLYRANITVGPPGGSMAMTTLPPTLIP